jgi:hypothetical protein
MMLVMYYLGWFFGLGNIVTSVAGSIYLISNSIFKIEKEDGDRYSCRH